MSVSLTAHRHIGELRRHHSTHINHQHLNGKLYLAISLIYPTLLEAPSLAFDNLGMLSTTHILFNLQLIAGGT
jgi:hypothetical protein